MATRERAFFESCVIAARAAYCQNDDSFTRNGTPVDLFDVIPTPVGFDSMNPTVGFSVNPYDGKKMLHEEYQILVDGYVSDVYPLGSIDPVVVKLVPGLYGLRLSALATSRYPDLDPGRECRAEPYILGRCDPGAPFSCRRADAAAAYPDDRAYIAVNSAAHCAHKETEQGAPLDPACSACTARICAVDPTCCGNPDGNLFPGSLVWDGRCTALRDQVCRTTPPGSAPEVDLIWPLGVLAKEGLSPNPVGVLRGAMGSFEGIVTSGTTQFAEGWVCDPDFPGTPSAVQISVANAAGVTGVLGATNTTLLTAIANQPLTTSGWRDLVMAECGGGARHGFRVQLPSGPAGREVLAYGIDLNVPGTPFSLLRGGRKVTPGAAVTGPRAAIFTGWVEPTVSDGYRFAVDAGPADKYRLWVNGSYVAGNWQDPVGTPGGFTLPTPAAQTLFLQKGIRYLVRVEYLRPDTSPTGTSRLNVTWARPLASPPVAATSIPTTALYPMAQSLGNGLQGTYFTGVNALKELPANSASTLPRTFGAVDHVWNDLNHPISGNATPSHPELTVAHNFGARFEGQIVPPVSGTYAFSLETDGTAQIFVNNTLVANGEQKYDAPKELCEHDICAIGGPLTTACEQNNFCTELVCANDADCCSNTWDKRCVGDVGRYCTPDFCNVKTQVKPLELYAGWKYDIRIEYHHQGNVDGKTARAATLKPMWALSKGRDVIPGAVMLAATDPPVSPIGTGINAAYFSDAELKQEYLSRVEPTLSFQAASPPSAARTASFICGVAGAPTCSSTPGIAPPSLASVETLQTGNLTMAMTLRGGTLTSGASLTVYEVRNGPTGETLVSLGSPALTLAAGGMFTTAPITVERRPYVLQAKQTVGGQTSGPSEKLAVNVTDPAAQPAPKASGSLAPDGSVSIGGTSAPFATVNVSVKAKGDPNLHMVRTAGADALGNWSDGFTMPPGSWEITITQTTSGHTSEPAKTVTVEVPAPPLNVWTPLKNQEVSCPTRTCLLSFSGSGANTTWGRIFVSDGDARFLVDLPTVPAQVMPDGGGNFTGQVALDHGKHLLKIFQRTNGAESGTELVTVLVHPVGDAIVIDSPTNGQVIDPGVTVSGFGPPRQGLPGMASVYQIGASKEGTCVAPLGPPGKTATKLADAAIDIDDSRFFAAVRVSGYGLQCLGVTHTQSSLSGAGTAESTLTKVVAVQVRPPAPKITKPARTGTLQPDSLKVAVSGTMWERGMAVRVYAERPFADPVIVKATPADKVATFSAELTLPAAGTYRLTATTVVDNAESARSAPVVIAVGDVTPPAVKVANPTDPARKPVREIPVTAANETGADFAFASWVTAVDPSPTGGAPVPLAASQIVCQPAAGPAPTHFPLGPTAVTCTATDAAGNSGSTTFLVVVQMTDVPVLTASNLIAEAQDAGGAIVNYNVTATGLAADCSPPGSGIPQPCSSWRPASAGLGLQPKAFAMNPTTGDLYMVTAAIDGLHLVRSTNGGGTWQELTSPGVTSIEKLVVQSGSPASLYVVPRNSDETGLRISRNGGQSWLTALSGIPIKGLAQDAGNPAHMVAWNSVLSGSPSAVYETRDAWATWQTADEGLPDVQIEAVALDPVNADRMYLSMDAPRSFVGGVRLFRLFRRVAGGPWRERSIFPFDSTMTTEGHDVFVAPSSAACATGAPFPAVFAGSVYSCDGGENWQETQMFATHVFSWGFKNMLFDRSTPGRILADINNSVIGLYTSSDHGKNWLRLETQDGFMGLLSLVQDPNTNALYAVDRVEGVKRSADGGRTWTTLASNLPVAGSINDLVADPVDPAIAYVAAQSVFKTSNGGQSWEPRTSGLLQTAPGFQADKILLHPLARNVLFTGSVDGVNAFPLPPMGLSWATSSDSAATWTKVVDSAGYGLHLQGMAVDPVVVGGWLGYPEVIDPHVFRWPTGQIDYPFYDDIFRLQMIPDAARTVVTSLDSDLTGGSTMLFSFRDAVVAGGAVTGIDAGLLGPANVVYDASDGAHRLFVSGKAVVGGDPHLLYTVKVDDLLGAPDLTGRMVAWQPLIGDGVFPAFQRDFPNAAQKQDSFTTLVIDPVGGGQTMYTLGSGNTLWESRNGGRSWRRDTSVPPGYLTAAWLSPVDGALYTTISASFADTSDHFMSGGTGPRSVNAPGLLWKRAPSNSIPPGARVARGNLRVTCQGPAGYTGPVLPGSKFPIGNTQLSCTATDAFGSVRTAAYTVTVRDTTAPVLTVPADMTLNTACTSAQNIGTASATDLVTPSSQIVITITGRPTNNVFKAGVTTVTYTARDLAGNISAARTQRVTVNLNDNQSCCPAGTTIRIGTSGNDTITGGTGADCILGLGGTDTLRGGGGNDFISGGEGNDQLFGDAGNDRLEGGNGNDTITGGADTDTCIGGAGTNTITQCNP